MSIRSKNDLVRELIITLVAIAIGIVMLVVGLSYVQTTWAATADVEDSTPAPQCNLVADNLVLLATNGYQSRVYADAQADKLKAVVFNHLGPPPSKEWEAVPVLIVAWNDENPEAFLLFVKDGCLVGHASGGWQELHSWVEEAFGSGA